MAKGRPLTLSQWVDRLLRRNADIVRKSRTTLPGYVRIELLGAELWSRGHLLIMTRTQIVVLRNAQLIFMS